MRATLRQTRPNGYPPMTHCGLASLVGDAKRPIMREPRGGAQRRKAKRAALTNPVPLLRIVGMRSKPRVALPSPP